MIQITSLIELLKLMDRNKIRNYEFYHDVGGKKYELHFTRIFQTTLLDIIENIENGIYYYKLK